MKSKLISYVKKHHLAPQYTELSLFLVFFSFALLLFFHNEARLFFFNIDFLNPIFIILFLLGIIASIYYTFNLQESPSPVAKIFMIFFAVYLEIFVCIALFYRMIDVGEASPFAIILGFFNIIQVFYLYTYFYEGKINENNIKSYNAKKLDITIGIAFVIVFFIIMWKVLHIDWEILFSLLLSYVVLFNNGVTGFMTGRV